MFPLHYPFFFKYQHMDDTQGGGHAPLVIVHLFFIQVLLLSLYHREQSCTLGKRGGYNWNVACSWHTRGGHAPRVIVQLFFIQKISGVIAYLMSQKTIMHTWRTRRVTVEMWLTLDTQGGHTPLVIVHLFFIQLRSNVIA